MHTKKIMALMNGNSRYDQKTATELLKMIRKYPYFQTAQLLYTLNLLSLRDAHFLYDVQKTAVYLNDRKKLFFLVENHFFDSDKIDTLQHEIPKNPTSGFSLIDSFLSENEEPIAETQEMQRFSPSSMDYAGYYLSENQEEESKPAKPLQFQDAIDRFLAKDAISPIKIELKNRDEDEETPFPSLEKVDDSDFFRKLWQKFSSNSRNRISL